MGPVSALLLTVCLANLVSSQSTEMDSGQCEQSNAVIYDIAEDGKATGSDVRRLREELARVEKQQQRLSTVIDDIRQMVMKIHSTLANGSSQMLKEDHSTTVNVSSQRCPEEFLYRNSKLGSCYFLSSTALSWNDAAEDCIHRGSYLAEIQSEEENDYLRPLVAGTYYWIGGNDIETENVWVWKNSGMRFTYTNWHLNSPNGEREQNCLALYEDETWTDGPCDMAVNYICEMKGQ